MTAAQLPLFPAPPTRGASRRSGPSTSRDAGRSMSGHVLRDQQALVLGAFGGWTDGSTAYEVWMRLQVRFDCPKENVISKRLGELVERGMLRTTGKTRSGSSSREQKVYELTEQGRAWLADRSAA